MATRALPVEQARKRIEFKHIVMATDFSAASERALGYAIAMARRYGAGISLVHAISPEPQESVPMDPLPRELDIDWAEAERAMAQLAEDSQLKHLRHATTLKRGRVWDVLSSAIRNERFDLLVLGTHGRGGLKKLALGSIAEEVIRLASCPVLTVGPHVTGNGQNFKNILFATDFGPASARAFEYALSLAEDCRTKLILLHMVEPAAVNFGPGAEELAKWQDLAREESSKKLLKLIPRDAMLAIAPEYLVGTDFSATGILNAASVHKADLIVMGANPVRFARLTSHIPWITTHDVLCQAGCPVLTVKR